MATTILDRSMITTERTSKKRRASDINLKEIFGNPAKQFSRREKKPRTAENSFDSRDLPDLKKLPLTKKAVKNPTTAARPSRSLGELLKRKAGILRFRTFLQLEFSEENFDFWIECETYKHRRLHKQRELFLQIYRKYVAVGAPREVNLDALTRRKTKDGIDYPDVKTFDLAKAKIFKLMEEDSFRRFRESLKKSKTESCSNAKFSNIVTRLTYGKVKKRKISM